MKLRILDDSIRLRLTQSEVAEIGDRRRVEGRTRFPGGDELCYALVAAQVDAPTASFEAGQVTVTVPIADALDWARSDRVGIESHLSLDHGELRVLIEKDFRCLAPRDGEDQSDAFAHPDAARGHT